MRKLAGVRSFFVFRFSFSPDPLSLKTKADQKFRGPQPIGTRVGIDGVIARNHIRATVQEVRPVQTDGHVRERKTQT